MLAKGLALWLDPTGCDAGRRLRTRAEVGRKHLSPACFISWCSLPDVDCGNGLGKGTQEKRKRREHVEEEDNPSVAQRCYSHRLALPPVKLVAASQ